MGPTALLAIIAGAAVLVAVLFLVLWLAALRRIGRARRDARDAGTASAQLEVAAADRGGRLRIVEELHDVAVHRLATIVTQAESAAYAGATDPSAAVRATGAIAELGRATLADLRRVTTLVREGEVEEVRAPGLDDLAAAMRESGLDVVLEQTGEPFELDPAAAVAVHRIVQDALDNALEYGGEGTAVRVATTWTANGLALRVDDAGLRNRAEQRLTDPDAVRAELAYTVDDDLRSLTRRIAGPGIDRMRARAELYGGTLQAVEVPGVGFSVSAAFPTIRFHNGVHGVELPRR